MRIEGAFGDLRVSLPAATEPVDAEAPDGLTLCDLLPRVSGSRRSAVLERLVELVPPPPGVSARAALALDEDALWKWRLHLQALW